MALKGRRERIKMRMTLRDAMIRAAGKSMDHRIFGYSPLVSDPYDSVAFDERRKAVADVKFSDKEIFVTFLNKEAEQFGGKKFCLRTCCDRNILRALLRLRWHPATPLPSLNEIKYIIEQVRNGKDI